MNVTTDSTLLLSKYQQLFTAKPRCRGYKKERLGFKDTQISLEQAANEYHEMMWSIQRRLFSVLMKAEWLDRHILYNNEAVPLKNHRRGMVFNTALKKFWTDYIGFSRSFLIIDYFRDIRSYADDFFPNFDEINPLEYDFPYPFEYMTLECLLLVYKLPDRMILLREGEDKKLSMLEFQDYLLAWMSEMYFKNQKQFKMSNYRHSWGPEFVREVLTMEDRLKRRLQK